MAFVTDKEVLKSGLIIFRPGDVVHRNLLPGQAAQGGRYQTIALQTADIAEAIENP